MDEIIESLLEDKSGPAIAEVLRDSGYSITEVDEALFRFNFLVIREGLTLYVSFAPVQLDSDFQDNDLGENKIPPQLQMAHRRYPPVTWPE